MNPHFLRHLHTVTHTHLNTHSNTLLENNYLHIDIHFHFTRACSSRASSKQAPAAYLYTSRDVFCVRHQLQKFIGQSVLDGTVVNITLADSTFQNIFYTHFRLGQSGISGQLKKSPCRGHSFILKKSPSRGHSFI